MSLLKVFVLVLIYSCSIANCMSNDNVPRFDIDYGEIKCKNTGPCIIKNDDLTYNYSGVGSVPGLWFGYIQYDCIKTMGVEISIPKCKPCGLFCIHNERVPECNSKIFTLIIGIIIGLMFMIAVTLIGYDILLKISNYVVSYIIYMYYLLDDVKVLKRTKRYTKHGNKSILAFKTIKYVNKNHRQLLEIKRAKLASSLTGKCKDNEYIEVMSKSQNNIDSIYPNINNTPVENYVKGSSKKLTAANVIVTGLAVSSIVNGINACDTTLYFHNNGKICDQAKCSDINMYSFPLQTGSVLCFNDVTNNVFQIEIYSTNIVTKYSKMYKTSIYDLKTRNHSRCVGEDNCWRTSCSVNTLHHSYPKIANIPNDHGCLWSVSGCNDNCWHGQRCNYYQFWLEHHDEYGFIYKRLSELWEVTIKINYKDSNKFIKLDVNNPSFDLNDFGLSDLKRMPIMITSFMSESKAFDGFILEYKGKYYNLKASELNFPETNIVGDFQIELYGNNSIYNTEAVKVIVQECKLEYSIPQSKLTRLINSEYKGTTDLTNYIKIMDYVSIKTTYPIHSTINIIIGNIEFNNLKVEKANCLLKPLISYGCKGCNHKQYTIMQAYKILQKGIMSFVSNCTYDVNYLSCSEEPYKIFNSKLNEICWLFIEKTNQTLYIDFNIVDLSKLDPISTQFNENDYRQIASELFTSSGFLNGILNTISIYGSITIVAAFATRLMKLYYAHVSARRIERGEV